MQSKDEQNVNQLRDSAADGNQPQLQPNTIVIQQTGATSLPPISTLLAPKYNNSVPSSSLFYQPSSVLDAYEQQLFNQCQSGNLEALAQIKQSLEHYKAQFKKLMKVDKELLEENSELKQEIEELKNELTKSQNELDFSKARHLPPSYSSEEDNNNNNTFNH